MIKKAVALTLREYWRAVHGTEPEKKYPCEYPGCVPECENTKPSLEQCRRFKEKISWSNCWDIKWKVNGKYPIRRLRGLKG